MARRARAAIRGIAIAPMPRAESIAVSRDPAARPFSPAIEHTESGFPRG
jgi:hypothetical protein